MTPRMRRLAYFAGWLGTAALLAAASVRFYRSIATHQPSGVEPVSLEKQDDWQAFGGTWQYADGIMRNNSDERGAKLMTGPRDLSDYSVEADVLLLGQYGDAGLIIRASDEEEGVDAYHGYMAGLRDLDNTLLLGRADYGWREYIARTVLPRVYAEQWYHVKVVAVGCDFAVSARAPDGKITAAAIDDPGCIRSGRFGLKSYNTGAEWRNVEIRPAAHQDLVAMIGNTRPPIAVPDKFPTGLEPAPDDKYFEPLKRDLLEHRTDVSAQPINSLRLLSPNATTPVTIHGAVTLTSPVLFVQDSTGGLAIPSSHPHAPLQIGDEIEARGDAELNDFSSQLHNADVRLLWSQTPVPPVAVTASQAATGSFDAQYVEIEGRLTDKRQDADHSMVLTLSDGTQDFLALGTRTGPATLFQHLKIRSRLRLRGICVVGSRYTRDLTPFAVLLPSFNDVEVLEGPPWWTTGHIIAMLIGALVLCLAGLTCYILIERWRLQAVLDERERLAHEMHDTLAQSFAGIGFQLEAIRDEMGEHADLLPQIDLARDMVHNSHEEARRSIAAMRPDHLEAIGLAGALKEAAERMVAGGSSIALRATSTGSERTIPLRISDTLLRIGHEAIANAVRHAHPAHIDIALHYRPTGVEMMVADDGSGFQLSADSEGFGIRGMHKRANSIGARFTVNSVPGRGTSVEVFAPLPPSLLRSSWQRLLFRLSWRKPSHGHAVP
ncbi:MAG: histidine kinase [Acidobacteriaceae bacterium]